MLQVKCFVFVYLTLLCKSFITVVLIACHSQDTVKTCL